ncbi:MAG: hypothetical protein IJI65_01980 [Lachnospiraceae bacterium]|nr:hypothetical protein [Lachnospiraceae bacterium]
MATSSIDHNFVVKDKKSVDCLAEALSTPAAKTPEPVKSISGEEAVTRLMSKWRNNRVCKLNEEDAIASSDEVADLSKQFNKKYEKTFRALAQSTTHAHAVR